MIRDENVHVKHLVTLPGAFYQGAFLLRVESEQIDLGAAVANLSIWLVSLNSEKKYLWSHILIYQCPHC